MTDPYAILGLPADCDDEAIRRRYLELVKQYPPEHHAERFAAVRAAYDQLRDLPTRLRHRLFDSGRSESFDALLEEVQCKQPRRRATLQALLATLRKA